MSIRRIADDKIVELWGNSDALSLMQQLGAIAPARQAARGQIFSYAKGTVRATQTYLNSWRGA